MWNTVKQGDILKIQYIVADLKENIDTEIFITEVTHIGGGEVNLADVVCLTHPDRMDPEWKLTLSHKRMAEYKILEVLGHIPEPTTAMEVLAKTHPEYIL